MIMNLKTYMKGKIMSIVEIDNGTKIEEYEYIDEDIDTYLVSSDDIDLSQEGFLFKQVKYDNSVEKKCKLVKKENVDRHYADWTETYTYYCGISCWYEDMGDHVRIFTNDVPKKLKNKFKYEEFLIEDPGLQFPPRKSHHYYKDVSYDDKMLQKDVVIKKHQDYTVDLHGITTDTNDEERKNLIVEYLIKKVGESLVDCYACISSLLYGSYGYSIPNKLYSTDLDLVFDKVLPGAYRLCAEGGPYAGPTFLRDLKSVIVNGYWGNRSSVHYMPKQIWIADGKAVYPSEDYAVFMMIQFHLKLMEKLKKQEYPYTLMELKNVSYCLKEIGKKYLGSHNKVYWNGKVICDDLSDYIKSAMEELVYFIQFE